MPHIIWRKSSRKKKISVASRLLGQHASHGSQFMLAASLAASTRFNTVWHQGLSNLIRLWWVFFHFCKGTPLLNGIRQNLSENTLSHDHLKFQLDLHNMNQLLTPITCGLETLEGQNTTCSDVFHIYIGFDIQIALSTNIARQHLTSSIADSLTS